jgi:SAM-dependent methyltransferase
MVTQKPPVCVLPAQLSPRSFSVSPEIYDAMVNWSKRLAREEPLYRNIFRGRAPARVLDAACGTGHHAALFHEWGHTVVGADMDPNMIAYCRAKHGESERLAFRQQSFLDPPVREAPFDVVICVGNSLANAGTHGALRCALANLLGYLRPGGVCVLHLLNIWRLPEGPVQWQKTLALTPPDDTSPHIIMKGVHRCGDRAFITFVELRGDNAGLTSTPHTQPLLGVRAHWLRQTLYDYGAADVRFYGDYEERPYEPHGSQDLIVACTRA